MQKCGAGKIDDVTVATLVRNLVEADHDLQISERRNRRPAAGTTTTKLPLSNMKTSGAVETFSSEQDVNARWILSSIRLAHFQKLKRKQLQFVHEQKLDTMRLQQRLEECELKVKEIATGKSAVQQECIIALGDLEMEKSRRAQLEILLESLQRNNGRGQETFTGISYVQQNGIGIKAHSLL